MSSSTCGSRQHRVSAKTVPRGSAVNARRPGRRPGRSAARSIDDGEHGTRLPDAMLVGPLLQRQQGTPSGAILVRITDHFSARLSSRFSWTIEAHFCKRGRRTLSGQSRAHCCDTDTHQRWRERPRVRQGQGHPRVTAPRSFTLSSPFRHPQQRGSTRRHTAPPRLDTRSTHREIKRLLGARVHGQPRGREGSVSAPKQGGQPDPIFAWPPFLAQASRSIAPES